MHWEDDVYVPLGTYYMKPAIAYFRVSTERQATEGVSLDAQRAKVAAWAEFNEYRLLGEFTDAGISGGSTDGRPGLEAALLSVENAGEGAVLIVYSLSRLARNTRDTLDIAERLEAAGADLVSLSEKIDTTSATGKMVFRLLAVLAEFERDQIAERTRMALGHKKALGERAGHVPYGKKWVGKGVPMVDVPEELRAIEFAAGLRLLGKSYGAIADALEAAGFQPHGKKWHMETVRLILRRRG